MTRVGIAAAIGLLASLACSSPDKPSFDHLSYSEASLAPGTAELEPSSVTLEQGIVIKARVKAIDENGDAMKGSLSLSSLDASVLEVTPGPDGTFVFIGADEGETSIHVALGDRGIGQVSARVVAQP
jgi:hypothetical protein